MKTLSGLSTQVKQYLIITGNYWAFTLTDGALRMLVVLYFHQLGYSPLSIALLFIFYEVFGVVTNLIGGWLGARLGLNKTMNIGLALQVVALAMLLVPSDFLTVFYVFVDLQRNSLTCCNVFLDCFIIFLHPTPRNHRN